MGKRPYRSEFNDPHVQQHRRVAAKRPDREADAIENILSNLLSDINRPEDPEVILLKNSWEQIVGAPIAKHSKPWHLIKGTLYVWVDHAGFVPELIRARRFIIMKIQRAHPDLGIRNLFVSLASR